MKHLASMSVPNLELVVALESILLDRSLADSEAMPPRSTVDSSESKQTFTVREQQSDVECLRLSCSFEELVVAS